jgi:uncharacterized protein YicC (UPF0701 family)
MIKSMTGFGLAKATSERLEVTAEVKIIELQVSGC